MVRSWSNDKDAAVSRISRSTTILDRMSPSWGSGGASPAETPQQMQSCSQCKGENLKGICLLP